MGKVQAIVVTPEATQVDEAVEAITVPLWDGEAQILADHAPMIGRLAPGELRIGTGDNAQRLYIDGGFVQVANNVVSVMTGRAITFDQIDVAAAQSALDTIAIQANDNEQLQELKNRQIAQARAQLRLASRS
ncbi:MAG TPA: ATP synthase F1 subunit epsilon [Pirellulaceae bacterium]|nr:ATP synthase F1 subunit epsilon [Pirellulaceae bacterium]